MSQVIYPVTVNAPAGITEAATMARPTGGVNPGVVRMPSFSIGVYIVDILLGEVNPGVVRMPSFSGDGRDRGPLVRPSAACLARRLRAGRRGCMALQRDQEIAEIGKHGVTQIPIALLCRHADGNVRIRFRRQPGLGARLLASVDRDGDACEIVVDTSIFNGARGGSTEESFEHSRILIVG